MKKVISVTIVVLFLVLSIVGVRSAINIQEHRNQIASCQSNEKGIAVAMHQYHEKYGHFPPAYLVDKSGKPIHSWRILLLEFLEPDLFEEYRFDEPWDGPNNRQLESRIPHPYACPSDPEAKVKWHTNYFVIVGKDTVFPGSETVRLDQIEQPKDSTILFVESIGQEIHWMEPRDLDFESLSFTLNDRSKPSLSSKHDPPRAHVAMVDASIIPFPIAVENLREMLLIRSIRAKK